MKINADMRLPGERPVEEAFKIYWKRLKVFLGVILVNLIFLGLFELMRGASVSLAMVVALLAAVLAAPFLVRRIDVQAAMMYSEDHQK